ncbi:MAG: hypothetical protein N2235_09135 [Fischerella sp.]|nr:hypothetical protein [Fischerella sp.]
MTKLPYKTKVVTGKLVGDSTFIIEMVKEKEGTDVDLSNEPFPLLFAACSQKTLMGKEFTFATTSGKTDDTIEK